MLENPPNTIMKMSQLPFHYKNIVSPSKHFIHNHRINVKQKERIEFKGITVFFLSVYRYSGIIVMNTGISSPFLTLTGMNGIPLEAVV